MIVGGVALMSTVVASAGSDVPPRAAPSSDAVRQPLPDRPHYAIEHFGERYGLASITPVSLAQDGRGFLWIGSHTGIYRYDGLGVASFGLSEGLPGLHTTQLLIAPDGVLWARMRKGLVRYDGSRFVPVEIPAQAGNLTEDMQSFALDGDGRLFVSVENGLLVVDKDGKPYLLGAQTGVPGGHVEAITRAPGGGIWFAAGGRLARLPTGFVQPSVMSAPTLPEPVLTLTADGHGFLWIRTAHHLATVDTAKPFPQELVLHDNDIPVASIAGGPTIDRHGNVIVATSVGLYRFMGEHWQVVDRSNGLTSSAVFSALEDREGTIWVGLAGAGLDRWTGSGQWSAWIDGGSLVDPLVLSIVRDKRQRLWVGTNTDLSMWDDARHHWQVWNKQDDNIGGGVKSLLLGKDGGLWALSAGTALTWFDTSAGQPVPIPVVTGKRASTIASVTLAPDGALWWKADKSLHFVRHLISGFTFGELALPPPAEEAPAVVSSSPQGALWMGGANGLSRFDGKAWRQFNTSDGLLDNGIRSVAAVNDSEVWVSYSDEDRATRARLGADGKLQVQHVAKGNCLLGVDRSGNAWLEMDSGTARVSPTGALRVFTRNDGLLWDDTNCGAFWEESDGTILIGTSHGLARYDAAQEDVPRTPPTVALTRTAFAGKDRPAQERLRVPYDQGSFFVQYAAVTLRDPFRVLCRYRLAGLESSYTETSLREARYSALPPGNYTFELACGSADTGWSAQPARYSFTVLPPWWRTPWAAIGAVLAIGALILILTRLRTRQLESERKRLEAAVAERSSELARLNTELQEASLTDPLTGCRNRRFFYSTIAADANQTTRAYFPDQQGYSQDHRDLIFYLIDLDLFKDVNDQFGHDAGDEVLMEVTRRLSVIVRKSDFLIRWGGEEFLVVCRAAERKDAAIFAEKILAAVAEKPFSISDAKQVQRTCSVGWAPYPWEPGIPSLSVDEVLKLADRALYRAKESGRNYAVGVLPGQPSEVAVGASSGRAPSGTENSDAREENTVTLGYLTREVISPGPSGPYTG
jgi:diguanylate cyclase (GGDEF)-like protein